MKHLVYTHPTDALRALTEQLQRLLVTHNYKRPFNLALSGGHTAQQMFHLWTAEYATALPWSSIRFFWADERCVAPTDPESNYGNASQLLFEPLRIGHSQQFRIHGENPPEQEAARYATQLATLLPSTGGIPFFDCIILGVGTDGHTASLFPSAPDLLTDRHYYAATRHPQNGQQRITMTGPLILNHAPLLVPAFGPNKTDILKEILAPSSEAELLPAGYILSRAHNALVFTA